MKLGAFSVSLNVKDLETSKAFYEKLGFLVFAGDMKMNYLIMKNGDSLIGLFQGMFENNILTFNPGWNQSAENLEEFDDVRTIQKTLKAEGMKLETEADETTEGPASFVVLDPDGSNKNLLPNPPEFHWYLVLFSKSTLSVKLKPKSFKLLPVLELKDTFPYTSLKEYGMLEGSAYW